MSSANPRQLPPVVLNHTRIQASAVLGLGSMYMFMTPSTIHSMATSFSTHLPFLPATLPVLPSILNHHLLAQQQQLTGVILMGIGSVYGLALWHQQHEYVYLSIPGRLVIASAGLLTWLVNPERIGVTMALVILNDGLGAALAAWSLGWDSLFGKVPTQTQKTD